MADLKPAYLVVGSDRPKIGRALQRLRERIGDDSTEHLSAREASGPDVVAACNALGLFGAEGRLVIVDDVERWKAADVKEVAAYLASPSPATVLALVGAEVKGDSALAKAVGTAGEVLTYDVPKRRLPEWVGEQFARVAVGRAETPIFAVTDAWGRRDVAAVLRATESLLERSHRPRSGELMRLVATLVSHVGRVRRIARLTDEGVRPRDAAGRLKMHPFAAEKAGQQAGSFSREELDGAIVRLARLDAAAKGGSRLPADLALERTLVEITRRTG
jgi:DNA polymerase III delta subunit